MELLQNLMSTPSASEKEVSDSIATLVDRLSHATLLTDRRAAVLGLKSFSRQYREIVIANGLKSLVATLHKDVLDLDIVRAVLETLLILFIRGEGDDDLTRSWISQQTRLKNGKYPSPSLVLDNVTDQFSLWIFDELTQSVKSFDILVDLVEADDIHIKLYSLQLLQALCSTRPLRTKELTLKSPLAISKLCQALDDPYEPIRNEAILLLMGIVKDNFHIQKLVVFENTFEKLYRIIEDEGRLEGNIVVQDCLSLIANLLRYNASNQKFFIETNCMYKLAEFLDQPLAESELGPFVWNEQRLQNLLTTLDTCRLFVAEGVEAIDEAQRALVNSDVLMLSLRLVFSISIPNVVRVNALLTTADIIRSNAEIQLQFSQIDVPYMDPTLPASAQKMDEVVPVIDALLHWCFYANSVHLFDLRMASVVVLHAYFKDNADAKYAFLKDQKYAFNKLNGVPDSEDELEEEEEEDANGEVENDANGESRSASTTFTGANLFATLINVDSDLQLNPYKIWFACLVLIYVFEDYNEGRDLAMSVQIGNASANEDVLNIIEAVGQALCSSLRFKDPRVPIAYMMLLSVWLWENFQAVDRFLQDPSILDQLLAYLVEANDENLLAQGMVVVLLAIVYEFTRKKSPVSRQQLSSLLKSRVGDNAFSLKIQQFEKSEAFSNYDEETMLNPDRDDTGLPQVFFDPLFVQLVKENSRRLRGAIGHDPSFEPLEKLSFDAFETVQNDCLSLTNDLKTVRKEADETIEKQKAEIERLISEYDELAKAYESTKSELEKLQKDRELLDTNYAKSSEDIGKLTQLKNELEQNLSLLTTRHQEATSKVTLLEASNKQLSEKLHVIEQQKSKAEDGINKMSRELMQLTKDHESQSKTIKNLEKEAQKMAKTHEKLQQQIAQQQEKISGQESKIQSLTVELKKGDDNYNGLRKTYEETVGKLKAAEQEIERLRSSHLEATRSFESMRKETEASTGSLKKQLMSLTTQKAELEALNEDIHRQLENLTAERDEIRKETDFERKRLQEEKQVLETEKRELQKSWEEEIQRLKQEKDTQIREYEEKLHQLESVSKSSAALERKLAEATQEKEELETTVTSLKKQLGETRELKNTATEEKKSLESTISMISLNVEAKDEECRRLMKEAEELRKEKEQRVVEFSELEKKLQSHLSAIEGLKSDLEKERAEKKELVAMHEKELQNLNSDLRSKTEEMERERALLAGNSDSVVKEYSQKINSLDEKLKNTQKERDAEVSKLEEQVKSLSSGRQELLDSQTSKEAELKKLEDRLTSMEENLKQKEHEVEAKGGELRDLRDKMKEQLRELVDLKKQMKEAEKLKTELLELEAYRERTQDYDELQQKAAEYDGLKRKTTDYEELKSKVADHEKLQSDYAELQKTLEDYETLKSKAAEHEQLQKQVIELEQKLKDAENRGKDSVPRGDVDDLMLLMSELDEKNKQMKLRLKSLGEEVSDLSDESDDDDDEE
ncbi:hypothetical protein KL906_003030 [Ogataea polymorpha]|uniref:Vesicle tethering protein Uso1/P115-like head domain-containing protein n=1 Tax=Ogataea polymorpha TaxID=460523 RepID=A0A9P8P3R3_9ASCO|nr:hypothetical protein KL906_003030 [Ogataea polymorpha]KAG7920922.1 hypothetical protein KL927_000166 [Ogataea polymorpha]KAH3664652.1 hypothetical protein OGATHE_003467 [Ogataea polymorpha]